jgi:hypothetical protein
MSGDCSKRVLRGGSWSNVPEFVRAATRVRADAAGRDADYYNYAGFLAGTQRNAEARQWAQRILDKKPTMPSYQRRRERPWFRRATAMLLRLRG